MWVALSTRSWWGTTKPSCHFIASYVRKTNNPIFHFTSHLEVLQNFHPVSSHHMYAKRTIKSFILHRIVLHRWDYNPNHTAYVINLPLSDGKSSYPSFQYEILKFILCGSKHGGNILPNRPSRSHELRLMYPIRNLLGSYLETWIIITSVFFQGPFQW